MKNSLRLPGFVDQLIQFAAEPMAVLECICPCPEETLPSRSYSNFVCYNKAFLSFLGFEEGSLPALRQVWPRPPAPSAESQDLVTSFLFASGEAIPVRVSLTATQNGFSLLSLSPIGQKVEQPTALHAQRLVTLGMLAGGVAHDFNNILAGMLGHLTYLKTILPTTGAHVESLNAIEEGGRKASLVTQQILNFSRLDGTPTIMPVELRDLISRMGTLLRGAISPRHSFVVQLPEQAQHVLGVESQIAQVIVNLVINARDALSSHGRIELELSLLTSDEQLPLEMQSLRPQEVVCLAVRDNGHGMNEEVLGRVFEPYFSTKKDKGTGMGLGIVKSIVQSMGGVLQIVSQEGQGTDVMLYLPRHAFAESGKVVPGTGTVLRKGSEHVLVIDDEQAVRTALALSLQHLGYKVETAESGQQGLEVVAHATSPIELVILDMLMPKMSGDVVFTKLRELAPNTKVLIISGYSSEDVVARVLEHQGTDFIQKPFTIEELSRKLGVLLG